MKLHRIATFLITTLLLAACASSTATPVVTENPTVPPTQSSSPTNQPTQPTQPTAQSAYPSPSTGGAAPTTPPYPGPGQSGTSSQAIPPSGYEPQPGDESLKRDSVTIAMDTSKVIVTASSPAQATVLLTGTMPDPCHTLRVVVTPADSSNTIVIEAYSLYDASQSCVKNVENFSATIPLGSYSSGNYTVNANGGKLGMFQTVFAPQPDDDKLSRDNAMVDMKMSSVVASATTAGNVDVDLRGTMPDPCHQLRIVMTPADPQHNIKLEVYSVFDSKTACITVIQPFEVIFPLGSFTTGHYSVYVNGVLLGEFDI